MNTKQQFQNIYDEFRTLVLNSEYYARRTAKTRKVLRALDIFLALFAGTSGVLSWPLWRVEAFGYPIGPLLLSLAAGVALVLAIARPYLKLEDEHERLSSIQGAYGAIAFVMEDVVNKIKTSQSVDETSETVYKVLRQVRGSLGPREDSPADRKLIGEMEAIVNQRYPMDNFYYPDDPASKKP